MLTSLQSISLKLKHRMKYSKKATFLFLFFNPTVKVRRPSTDYCRLVDLHSFIRVYIQKASTNTTDMDTSDCPCSPLTHNGIHTCFCTFNVQNVNCPSPRLHMSDGAALFCEKTSSLSCKSFLTSY